GALCFYGSGSATRRSAVRLAARWACRVDATDAEVVEVHHHLLAAEGAVVVARLPDCAERDCGRAAVRSWSERGPRTLVKEVGGDGAGSSFGAKDPGRVVRRGRKARSGAGARRPPLRARGRAPASAR